MTSSLSVDDAWRLGIVFGFFCGLAIGRLWTACLSQFK